MRKNLFYLLISILVFTNVSASAGNFIHRNSANNIYYFSGQPDANGQMAWKQIDGAAQSVAITADGQIMHIGMDNAIYYSSGLDANGKPNWNRQNGTAAVNVAAAGNNFIHRNSANNIYYFSGKPDANGQMAWKQIDGAAQAVAITADGQIMHIGMDNAIYYSSGLDANGKPNWNRQNGTAAVNVAAAGNNFIHRNSANNIYYFSGKPDANGQMAWKQIDGAAQAVAITADGQIMHIGMDNAIYYSSGLDSNGKPNWKQQAGTAAVNVAAAAGTVIDTDISITDGNVKHFIFDPTMKGEQFAKTNGAYYNANHWIFATPDKGTLKFKAKPSGDDGFLIQFRSAADMPFVSMTNKGWYYNLIINTTGATLQAYYADVPKTGQANWDRMATAGTTNTLKTTTGTEEDWWIDVVGANTIVGKGTVAGEGTQYKFTVPTGYVIAGIKYFALGGLGSKVEYKHIESVTEIDLNIPDGFTSEVGNFERVSVGSKGGELEVWAINEKGKLLRYDPFAGFPYEIPSLETINPWIKNDPRDTAKNPIPSLTDIAVSSDGEMVAIRGDDKTAIKYDWTNKVWNKLPASNAATIKLVQIAIANNKTIYAVSQDGAIYNYTGSAWTKISDGIYIAVGLLTANKAIVIGVSDNGSAYEFVSNKWKALTGATNIDEVTIGNENNIFGVGKDGLLWQLDYKTSKWAPVLCKDKKQASGFSSISVNTDGTIFALDGDGDVFNKGDEGVKVVTAAGAKTPVLATATKQTRAQAVKTGKTKAKVAKKVTVKKKSTKKVVKKVVKKAVTPKVKVHTTKA